MDAQVEVQFKRREGTQSTLCTRNSTHPENKWQNGELNSNKSAQIFWYYTREGYIPIGLQKNCMLMPCKFVWNVTIKIYAFYNQLEDRRKIWLLRFQPAACGLVYMAPVCKWEKKDSSPGCQSSAQGLGKSIRGWTSALTRPLARSPQSRDTEEFAATLQTTSRLCQRLLIRLWQ